MIQGFSGGLLNRELIYNLDLPSFQRDFASLKTLDHGTGPAITFTRASGATYFDVNGVLQTASNDVPRFDHDPADGGKSLGLLIEEARTNLLERSAEFDNAYWSKTNGSISANATTAPDGATSADRLVEDSTASASHLVARNVAGVAPTQQLTGSCFIKADTRTFARIVVWDSSGATNNIGATFDVSNGTVASFQNSGNATGASASITSVGDGWYRCSVSGIPNTSGSNSGLAIYLMATGGGAGSSTYTGDGTSGLYIWGAQLEAGAFPTSYIPTTNAAATRSADSAVVTPISSFYNQSEGTLFAAYQSGGRTSSYSVLSMNIADNSHDVIVFLGAASNGTGPTLFTRVANINKATAPPSPVPAAIANFNYSIAGSYSAEGVFASRNGASAEQSSNGEYPTGLTRLFIGSSIASQQQTSGHIRKIAYYPKRLTNTLLEQLTT